MDFQLTPEQVAVVDSVTSLLDRRASPARARALAGTSEGYDHELDAALTDAGFLDLHRHPEAGPLEAALVVEAVARAAGLVAIGARALVAPGTMRDVPPELIALMTEGDNGPVRFGAHAATVLIAGNDDVRVVALTPEEISPVETVYGYTMARLALAASEGVSLGRGTAGRMRAWWQVALAVEMAGAMQAALALTVAYTSERHQFGRPIASLQAVQHRLAETAVLVEASRWLALEAAWLGAPPEAAAVAATQAAAAAGRVCAETHQLTGAIGFTTEYDLQVWTMRLQALRLELGGVSGHARSVAAARWPAATATAGNCP